MLPAEASRARRPARDADGTLRAPLAILALAAALVAGCGGDDDSAAEDPEQSTLELRLDIDGPGGKEALRASVECPDPGIDAGREPCALVDELSPSDLEPVAPDTACTEIFGGPETLRVTGTIDGEPVDATLTRENGCEIARFDPWVRLLRGLFPAYRPGEALQPG